MSDGTILTAIDDAIAVKAEPRRGYLGFSSIGDPDERTLWLTYRWCLPDDASPRTRRIWRLGHAIEDIVADLLRQTPGIELYTLDPETGKQFRVTKLGGHFSGGCDGILRGIPGDPATWHIWECKSAKADKYNEYVKLGGVRRWSITYWTQCQCYMAQFGLDKCLFMVYNKDTSELSYEIVLRERSLFYATVEMKAENIITLEQPPQSTYSSRNWFEIKNFKSEEYQAVYWGDVLPEKLNCRNCRHSRPLTNVDGAAWYCSSRDKTLTTTDQVRGCKLHNWIPALVKAEVQNITTDSVEYKTSTGQYFVNSPQSDDVKPDYYSSSELIHLSKIGLDSGILGDPHIAALRETFNGRIVDGEAQDVPL